MAKNPTSVDNSNALRRLETSSRCVTERVIGTHTFEVADFSLLDGMGIGKFVTSMTFSIGGCDWHIKVYPDGSIQEHKGAYVSVFLCLRKYTSAIRVVQFSLYLLEEKDGSVSALRDPGLLTHTFASTDDDWGLPQFVEKSKLKEFLRRLVNTTVVIPSSNDLHHDLARLLKDSGGADVTFEVDYRLFHAHRLLLAARSPVFKAELFGPLKKDTNPIKVDDMEASIFEELLHFIYTDRMSDKFHGPDRDLATQHLLVAADRYGLDRLRLMCEAKLCRGIDAQTVATTLALADQHSCVHLKDACITFLASGDELDAVMETDGFKHLAASCPFVMVEILDKIAKLKSH
nr:unnamed protein product [Digitaria exilis]